MPDGHAAACPRTGVLACCHGETPFVSGVLNMAQSLSLSCTQGVKFQFTVYILYDYEVT